MKQYPYIYPKKGTFAGFTLKKRFPKILKDVLDHPDLNMAAHLEIKQLLENLNNATIEKLTLAADEKKWWTLFEETYNGVSYEKVPFFYLEIYFYKLINSLIERHQPDHDAFSAIKQNDVAKNKPFFEKLLDNYADLSLEDTIKLSVEGNQSDLSQIEGAAKGTLNYLIKDSINLEENQWEGTHILADNSGVELFTDLVLALKLTSYGQDVCVHLKNKPLLVSDASHADLEYLKQFLRTLDGGETFVKRLTSSTIIFRTHAYWHSPVFYDVIPEEVIAKQDKYLLISKGDANYRRFYHDKDFSPVTTISLSNNKFKNILALRTLKSDIQTSMEQESIEQLNIQDPDWMHNGKHAVIQWLK